MENIRPSELAEICADPSAADNDEPLRLRIGRDAEGTPWKAEILAGDEPLFDLPIDVEPPLPADTPASAPNAEVEAVKTNILGWLNLALKEAARLNVKGRESMCGFVMSEVQDAMKTVRKYVC